MEPAPPAERWGFGADKLHAVSWPVSYQGYSFANVAVSVFIFPLDFSKVNGEGPSS